MASIPQGVCVRIPLPEHGNYEIFYIPVVWRGTDESPSGTQRCKAASGIRPWRVKMLHYFRAYDQIEWLLL